MPATFTHTPPEVEKKDTGTGGKPPVVRRPTGGGGDGDNWQNQPPGRRGPRELLGTFRRGLFFGLAGDMMFFAALASAFFVQQQSGHIKANEQWIVGWHPISMPPILWINTLVLLVSSITMEKGRRHLFHEPDVMEEWLGLGRPAGRRAMPWLVATLALGALFLLGQWAAWEQLQKTQSAYFASNPSSHYFYLLTGMHAAHLVVGLAALVAAIVGLYIARRVVVRQVLVDCTAWYWHAMGVLWALLFLMLVFFQ